MSTSDETVPSSSPEPQPAPVPSPSAATSGQPFAARVLGEWRPPAWIGQAVAWFRARPDVRLGGPLAVFALAALVTWWFTREVPPLPDAIHVRVEAPARSDYSVSPVGVAPLRLRFSAPVAALDRIGTDAGTAARVEGLRLVPDLAGRWAFEDEQTLAFQPAEDWPVGESFEVSIDPARAIASGRVLAQTRWAFESAAFSAEIATSEFYQDPENVNLKRAVWSVRFSHPVDGAALRARLAIAAGDGALRSTPPPEFDLRLAEDGLTAWVQTAPLVVPENGGHIVLKLAEGAKSRLPGPGRASEGASVVQLPSRYSVRLDGVDSMVVDDENGEPKQLLVLQFNDTLKDRDVAAQARLWLLPEGFVPSPSRLADPESEYQRQLPYSWSEGEVDAATLEAATRLRFELLPGEREWASTITLRYQAPPERRLWLELPKGLRSFGGFLLGDPQHRLLEVPDYPRLLRFVGDGALLSLRGERRVSIAARNTPDVRLEIGRVLPEQLQMLVANNDGKLQNPSLWRVDEDMLVERFEETLAIPTGDPAKAHYRGVDLGAYFNADQRGVFLLSLRSMRPDEAALSSRERLDRNVGEAVDTRLVVLTDLGVLAKTEIDGRRKVFVQRLSDGTPASGALVSVVGRNGQVVADASSDVDGVASLPPFDAFLRERTPVLLRVTLGDDMSFLPVGDWSRRLDTSRFDVGGEVNMLDPGTLKAVLFSDRGLYRPGETVHLGVILRAQDWARTPLGAPFELDILDPAGNLAARETIRFGAAGFEGHDFTPPESGPSGTWMAQLFLKGSRDDDRRLVGSTNVQVREFRPDTLRVKTALSTQAERGWVAPDALRALVDVENLFGTPAQDRRVTAQLRLTPSVLPDFAQHPGFRFLDPRQALEGVQQELEDARTDAEGRAEFDLGLGQYERAVYRLDLLVRAYEPGSGRGVASTLRALVSDQPWLVGIRAPESLGYVNRGSRVAAEMLVIGPDGAPLAVEGLQAVRFEKRMVSVLTRREDGLYRFVSRERREEIGREPLAAAATAQSLVLATSRPGDFALEIQDRDGRVLNTQAWTVAGDANLSRSLERNAELQINLSKPSYAPGEAIEVSIRGPYAGAGLITIERDRVWAQQWFKVDTTSTVQRIRLPEGLEGNAYVSVTLLRDPASDAIHLSPLSWGVVPFAIDRAQRLLPLSMSAPPRSRPGQPLAITVDPGGAARVAVFAVDEGILQVAGYRVGDPLDQLFARKMHQVESAQILDLVLPEFARFADASAPGGDAEGAGARHLNPFKRKGEKPAVWWSGVVDIDAARTFQFAPPDHFNGELRLVAVAVSPERMRLVEGKTTIRGDFVLTPTLPTHVAPGDEFVVPVGVANTIEGATEPVRVDLRVEIAQSLGLVDEPPAAFSLEPGEETVVRLRLRAQQALGAVPVTLRASSGRFAAQRRVEVSVRPLQPSLTTIVVQSVARPTAITGLRAVFDERAQRRLAASRSPLVALIGLDTWLGDYRYNCTEQLASKALPGLVLRSHPALGRSHGDGDLSGLFDTLRSRQNGDGGFGTWTASPYVDPMVSAYAVLVLVEARERGERVPGDLLDRANQWLAQAALDASRNDLAGLRARALAVYLQVRQGEAAGNALAALVEQLERDQPDSWRNDLAGLLVAASFHGLQQTAAAAPLARRHRERANEVPKPWSQLTAAEREAVFTQQGYGDYYDPLGAQAWRLYLLGKHFPQQTRLLTPEATTRLLGAVNEQGLNSLNSALAVLALDAVGGSTDAPVRFEQEWRDGKASFGEVRSGVLAGSYRADATRLRVIPENGSTVWVAQIERGFDRNPPPAEQGQGLEVQRDFFGEDGKPATTVEQGKELTVRLRVRGNGWDNVALLDLLPGGFEPVLVPRTAAEGGVEAPVEAIDQDGDGLPDEASPGAPEPQAPVLALPESTFQPDHEEIREDRVVLYGSVAGEMQEFVYRIRATTTGSFQVPPAFAEHMYRNGVIARGGPAGTITVTEPAR
ncbi:MAG: alpha-2-macroglobulin family protein [Pseudomonadota bacterium]